MPSRISGSESTSTCANSTSSSCRMPAALAENPHWGMRGWPFMNSTTRLSWSRVSMRVRRAGSRLMVKYSGGEFPILRPWHHPRMGGTGTLHRVPRRPHAWLALFLPSQALVALAWWALGRRVGLPLLLLTHLPFVAATLMPRARLYAPVLSRLPRADKAVWLTIDDGPSEDTLPILDLLDAHRARATFFLVGARAAARPALVAEAGRRGHGGGGDRQTHPQAWFWVLGPRRMAREVGDAQRVLTGLAGRAPRWFRSVVGMTNPFVAAPLKRHGLARAAWTARGCDAVRDHPLRVAAQIERRTAPA